MCHSNCLYEVFHGDNAGGCTLPRSKMHLCPQRILYCDDCGEESSHEELRDGLCPECIEVEHE